MTTASAPQKENFLQVLAQYRVEKHCKQLKHVPALRLAARYNLLRDYKIKPVFDEEEIQTRSRMDALLHACSIIEIGISADVLFDGIGFGTAKLLPFLYDPAICTYYEIIYPIALPQRYCARLVGREDEVYYGENYGWFARLLALDHEFRDSRLEEFLMIVDGFYIEWFDFDDLKRSIRNDQVIAQAFVTPDKKRSIEQRVIVGLQRFLLFCGELEKLLTPENRVHSLLGDLAFELYRYWFVVRGDSLREIVDRALRTLGASEPQEALPDRRAMQRLFERGALPRPDHVIGHIESYGAANETLSQSLARLHPMKAKMPPKKRAKKPAEKAAKISATGKLQKKVAARRSSKTVTRKARKKVAKRR